MSDKIFSAGEFEFRLIDDPYTGGKPTSKLMNYEGSGKFERSGIEMAEFRGKCLQLFGKPLHDSDDAEEAFEYRLEVKDLNGALSVLTVYHGPSGPAVGAEIFKHEKSLPAAKL